MADVISVKGLRKYFGKLYAVDDVDLQVTEGEIFGFLGPNGAGKSTTIRCMMGFIRPTDGSVNIFGYDMSRYAHKAKKRIGYLPGNVKLYENWTGWEHIRFFEGARGKSKILDDLIKRLDFNPDMKFRHLSSGNKQKLGLILALMNEPDLLIMDEPTVGLDPLLQNEIYKILHEMKSKGVTIFISSHNLPEVERLCDRVALIKDGKIVTVSNIADLAQKKSHKIVFQADGEIDLERLKQLKNVQVVGSTAVGTSITASGDISEVVRYLSDYRLKDLTIEHASLEDVFMNYYKKES